jgi:tetratricopeptide (TPR) repeat protein
LYGAAQNEIVRDSSSQIVVYQSTPLNQWTPQTIDFTALYRQFDRPLPALRVTTQTRVEMLTRPVKLSWIIGDSSEINTLDTEWWIGRIEQPISPNSALDAVKSMTEHPDLYYILIGNRALEQRETQTALQAYQKALTYNPRNPDIYVGLARTSLSLNDLKKSVQFYQLALTYGIQDGSQRKQVLQMLKFLHNEISSNMCCF